MNNSPLPEPVIIPGIMELIRANKDRFNLETFDMTFEEMKEYFRRGRIETPSSRPTMNSPESRFPNKRYS
jgi:hypothetical protein